MTFSSDSGHYYMPGTGHPFYSVQAKDGTTRATTLRDARKVGAVPSVTTIMKVMAKDGLNVWLQKQAILAALTLPRDQAETDDAYCDRILADSKEQGRAAAERGSEVHGAIELAIQGRPHLHADLVQRVILTCNEAGIDLMAGEAERSFATADYGGKVDWHCRPHWLSDDGQARTKGIVSGEGGAEPIVLDFKTKDKLPVTSRGDVDPRKLVFDEHGIQLAAYANGLHLPHARRVNVFVGMDGNVYVHEHDPADYARDLEMFNLMKRLWQLQRGYNPAEVAV